jgi:hypothetical protein
LLFSMVREGESCSTTSDSRTRLPDDIGVEPGEQPKAVERSVLLNQVFSELRQRRSGTVSTM